MPIRSSESSCKVSVILPVFNDENGLQACLSALAEQDYPLESMEVIVVDNGSTPPVILSGIYPFPCRTVRHTRPGSYAARNAGARVATGDVLAFTDADCVPDKSWLSAGVGCLLKCNFKHFVGGEVAFFELKKRSATALYQAATGFGQESNMREKCFTATANLLCTAQQFEEVGPFDERLLSGGDREWAWRATRLGLKVQYEPKSIVHTHPRYHFCSAARQVRRVAAGRMMIKQLGLAHAGPRALARQRSPWKSLVFIATQKNLTFYERFRVFCVAISLRAAYAFENLKLRLGTPPERR